MSKSTGAAEEYDADKEFGAAIKALSEAAWHMRVASYAVDEDHEQGQLSFSDAYEWGAVVASTDVLAVQIDALGTQARRLRKRARSV